MRAVVFKGPYKVALEDRPVPQIQDPTDIVVKVIYSALCGRSEDMERGHWWSCRLMKDLIVNFTFSESVPPTIVSRPAVDSRPIGSPTKWDRLHNGVSSQSC